MRQDQFQTLANSFIYNFYMKMYSKITFLLNTKAPNQKLQVLAFFPFKFEVNYNNPSSVAKLHGPHKSLMIRQKNLSTLIKYYNESFPFCTQNVPGILKTIPFNSKEILKTPREIWIKKRVYAISSKFWVVSVSWVIAI